MGVPLVVFDSGGMSEALLANESGYVLEQKNTSDLALKIIDLFTDDVKFEYFIKNVREQVEVRHNLTIQCKQLENIYASTIEKFGNNK
jgi:colanic acid/amylovoran biosynthesis glycosyltransferase